MALASQQKERLIQYSKRRLGEKADLFSASDFIDSSLNYKENKQILRAELIKFLSGKSIEKGIDLGEISTRNLVVNFNRQIDQAVAEKLAQEIALSKEKESQALSMIKSGGSEEAKAILNEHFGIIKDLVQTVAESNLHMAIIHGKGGISKSYSTLEALNAIGKQPNQDYFLITGHITNLKFYQLLYQHRGPGEILILDDISLSTLKQPLFSAMLKAAGWSASGQRMIQWHSNSRILEDESTPSSFIYEGKLILLANSLPDSQEFEAVKTRALTKEIALPYNQMKKVFYALSKLNYDSLSDAEKQEVCDYLFTQLSPFHENMQLRTLFQAFEIFRTRRDKWKMIIDQLLNLSPDALALKQAVESSPYREEQAQKFFELTGMARRTFFNRIRQYGL